LATAAGANVPGHAFPWLVSTFLIAAILGAPKDVENTSGEIITKPRTSLRGQTKLEVIEKAISFD
jgi:hypothetical protein